MRCAASKLEVDLMPDHSVVIRLRCDSAYETAVLFEDIADAAKHGSIVIDFELEIEKAEGQS